MINEHDRRTIGGKLLKEILTFNGHRMGIPMHDDDLSKKIPNDGILTGDKHFDQFCTLRLNHVTQLCYADYDPPTEGSVLWVPEIQMDFISTQSSFHIHLISRLMPCPGEKD